MEKLKRKNLRPWFQDKPAWLVKTLVCLPFVLIMILGLPVMMIISMFTEETLIGMYKGFGGAIWEVIITDFEDGKL